MARSPRRSKAPWVGVAVLVFGAILVVSSAVDSYRGVRASESPGAISITFHEDGRIVPWDPGWGIAVEGVDGASDVVSPPRAGRTEFYVGSASPGTYIVRCDDVAGFEPFHELVTVTPGETAVAEVELQRARR